MGFLAAPVAGAPGFARGSASAAKARPLALRFRERAGAPDHARRLERRADARHGQRFEEDELGGVDDRQEIASRHEEIEELEGGRNTAREEDRLLAAGRGERPTHEHDGRGQHHCPRQTGDAEEMDGVPGGRFPETPDRAPEKRRC
jgi:hypothetical protein